MTRRILLLLVFCAPVLAQEHPLSKDRTGMRWVLPFRAALKKAGEDARLLMIKPVAFGTSPDGGW